MKISIIGCGKMGSAMANRLAKGNTLALFDRHQESAKKVAHTLGAQLCSNIKEAASFGEFVILAVKPQDLHHVAPLIARELRDNQLIVSILAGVTTDSIQAYFPNIPVLRIMPNLALIHGKGVIGLADSSSLPQSLKEKAQKTFECFGFLHWIPEKQIDALTAITGSGPAFLLVLIESIVEAGITMGFPASEAKTLATELMAGVVALLQGTDKHPAEIKWEIASPSGTTIAGLNTLEDHNVRSGLIHTFLSTYLRSQELSREKGE